MERFIVDEARMKAVEDNYKAVKSRIEESAIRREEIQMM